MGRRATRRLQRNRHDRAPDDVTVGGVDTSAETVSRAYERHAAAIAAYALRRASPADAADVVADTFLVAWRRHDEIPAEPHTLPWLYGVARRVLSNQRRSRDRRTRLHERLRNDFVAFDGRPDRVEDTAHYQRVAAAMASLSPDDAELLRLTAWEGLSPTQIATMMQLEPSAVRQRLRRARQRLKNRLALDTTDDLETTGPSGRLEDPSILAPRDARWSAGEAT